MESVITAVLTLIGVLVSSSRSQAMLGPKICQLVEKYNLMMGCHHVLAQRVTEVTAWGYIQYRHQTIRGISFAERWCREGSLLTLGKLTAYAVDDVLCGC